MRLSLRRIFASTFLLCAGMLAVGYWMQYRMHLQPCPLCMTQRVFIFAVGVAAGIGALHGPARVGANVYAVLVLLLSIGGSVFSGRHLWLQSLPADQVPACGPSIDYILDTFPPMEILQILLRGTGDCAKVDWSFLGVSIPGWTLLGFVIMATAAVTVMTRRSIPPR